MKTRIVVPVSLVAGAAGLLLGVGVAEAGQYQLVVTRKSSDFYQVQGQNYFIDTFGCSEMSFGASAVLDSVSDGTITAGTLTFPSRTGYPDVCTVRGVYEAQTFNGRALDRSGNVVQVASLLVPVALK